MISKHLKDIKKLLKAYHKKYNWEGKPVKKETKKERRKNNGCIYSSGYHNCNSFYYDRNL
jgi:regulator of replication initiation timing